ncbi:MAG TPA: hypothetical protein VJT71_13885 [Pyrinomonadaceae bacterium]|nr:hypothetical protein [Pyrinomonadaceae bacterium]
MVKLTHYFWILAEQAPSLLAMLGGIVFALTRWKRYPKVSLAVALGLGFLLLHVIVFMFIYDLVPPMFLKDATYQSFEERERIRRIVSVILGIIYNASAAVGFGILVAGIFMQRRPAPLSDAATPGT